MTKRAGSDRVEGRSGNRTSDRHRRNRVVVLRGARPNRHCADCIVIPNAVPICDQVRRCSSRAPRTSSAHRSRASSSIRAISSAPASGPSTRRQQARISARAPRARHAAPERSVGRSSPSASSIGSTGPRVPNAPAPSAHANSIHEAANVRCSARIVTDASTRLNHRSARDVCTNLCTTGSGAICLSRFVCTTAPFRSDGTTSRTKPTGHGVRRYATDNHVRAPRPRSCGSSESSSKIRPKLMDRTKTLS